MKRTRLLVVMLAILCSGSAMADSVVTITPILINKTNQLDHQIVIEVEELTNRDATHTSLPTLHVRLVLPSTHKGVQLSEARLIVVAPDANIQMPLQLEKKGTLASTWFRLEKDSLHSAKVTLFLSHDESGKASVDIMYTLDLKTYLEKDIQQEN